MPDFWVGGGGCRSHNGVEDDKRDGLFLLDWGILYPVSFEFLGKTLVQDNVSLRVRFFYRVGYAIQEVS